MLSTVMGVPEGRGVRWNGEVQKEMLRTAEGLNRALRSGRRLREFGDVEHSDGGCFIE
jgi:hypothetical protein